MIRFDFRFKNRVVHELNSEFNLFCPPSCKNCAQKGAKVMQEERIVYLRKQNKVNKRKCKNENIFPKYINVAEDDLLKILNDTKQILIDRNKKDVAEFKKFLSERRKISDESIKSSLFELSDEAIAIQ